MAKDSSDKAVQVRQKIFAIGGVEIAPGENRLVHLPISGLFDQTPVAMTVRVYNGSKLGPCLFVSAAIHGDEINGVEVIDRLVQSEQLAGLSGTLIAVPVVNIFGFFNESRYLPDRRDLNRCFPGSARGSLAARLARLFVDEIVSRCTHGIDLHTGAVHHENFPQIRANLNNVDSRRMSEAFGAEVVINAGLRDGSLRQAAERVDVPVVVYEAGEALRFDETAIEIGVKGVINVMRHLGMLSEESSTEALQPSFIAASSSWVRAPASGIFRSSIQLGAQVQAGQSLGSISDPFRLNELEVSARNSGRVIGRNNLPLVHEGDALFHIVATEGTQCQALSLEASASETMAEEVANDMGSDRTVSN